MARDYRSSNIIYNPVEAEKKRHSSGRDYRKAVGASGSRDYKTSLANAEQKRLSDEKAFQSLPNLNQSINTMNNAIKPTERQVEFPVKKQPTTQTITRAQPNAFDAKKADSRLIPVETQEGIGNRNVPTRQEWLNQEAAARDKQLGGAPGIIRKPLQVIGGAIDRLQTVPGISNFQQGAGNALGIEAQTAPLSNGFGGKAAGVIGNLAGYATNPAALEQNLFTGGYKVANGALGTKLGQSALGAAERGIARTANVVNPLLNRVGVNIGSNLTNKVAERALTGGIANAYQNTALEASKGNTDLKSLGEAAALGGAFGAAGDVVSHGAAAALSKIFKRNGLPEKEVQEILALPMGREDAARLRRAPQNGSNGVVTPEYTFGLPEPRVNAPVATNARIVQRANPYREKYNELIGLAHETKFTPGRESEELEQLWSSIAGKNDPSLDELVKLAHPTYFNKVSPGLVSKARNYQAAREVAGAPLPIKGTEQVPQGAIAEAAPITQKIGRAPGQEPLPTVRQPESIPAEANRADAEAEQIVNAVKQPRVRDRVYNYLDEAEKAARQRMAKRRGNLNSSPLPEWGDMTIIAAAKMGKGSIKLADFTEEMVKEFGEKARNLAPKLYQAGKEELRKQERRASKEGQDAAAFNAGAGDAASFEKKITRGKRSEKKSFVDKWEAAKTQFVEDVAPINRFERNVTGRIAPDAKDSIYKATRNFKGVPEKITHIIDTQLKPIVRSIEKAGYHSDDLGRYALAVHAKDVNAAGYKSGFTNSEIDDVIAKFGTPEMEAARKELVKINNETLDGLADSGVISTELRDVLRERWQNYIPLNREVDDVVGRMTGLSQATANVANPIKALKGSEKNVIEPLENMVQSIAKNVNAAERNKVALHLPRLAKIDTEGQFIRKMSPDERLEGKTQVTVKENGESVHYEVEKDVYNALLTLDKESSTALIRFLSTPASWLRAGATLTPEFVLRNPIRDYRNARIISESGFRLDDWAVGAASAIMGKFGKGKLYQDWVKNLGAYGNMVTEDRNSFAAAQRKVLTQSASQKFWNVVDPRNLISLMRNISDITESATKVGEYRAALRSGVSKEEAAYRSRDLMDFARAGTSIRQTNKIIAFVNASIQGKSRTFRAFKANPVRTSVRVFQHMAIPTVGIYYSNKFLANDTQKDTIKNAPAWQKNTFWLWAIPGTDTVARIPKPFDFAAVANVIDRSLDFFQEHDKEAFEGFGQGLIADNALPMMITGIQPLLEGSSNYSWFRQGPIIPQRDSGLEFKDQYDPTKTSETAKFIAKGVDTTLGKMGGNFRSPYIIDNTIQGLFAGGGKYATDALDKILSSTGAADRPATPKKSLEQLPVVRSFTVDPLQGGQAMDKLYNLKDDLNRQKTSASRNKMPFPDAEKSQLKRISKATDSISKINTKIREIEANKTMGATQKRNLIEPLIKSRNKISSEAVRK